VNDAGGFPTRGIRRHHLGWESRGRPLLAKVMEEFHLGTRQDQLMFAMSFLMGKSDIDKLSDYHARQRTP